LVWNGGILAMLLLPLVSLALPWQLPVESAWVPAAMIPVDPDDAQTAVSFNAGPETPGMPSAIVNSERLAPSTSTGRSPAEWLFVIWAVGFLFFLVRLWHGAVLARRVVSGARRLDSPDWTHPLIEAADRISVSRLPRLLTNDRVPMPVVCGVFKPAIVVPAEARYWSDRRRRAVLCHELGHIRRLDLPANLLGRLACAFHWFNPLVWFAARKLRAESERACDDFVLGVGTRPSEYADHLLQIVGGAKHAQAPSVAIPMAQRSEFEGRMLAILDQDLRREPASAGHLAGVAVLASLLLLPVAAMTPVPAQDHTHSPDSEPAATTGLQRALLEGLASTDVAERIAAANALGTLREHGGVRLLGERLRDDPDSTVQLTSAWALGQIGSPDATVALSAALVKGSTSAVRAMAAWALGQIADPSALPVLESALNDEAFDVRRRAAWAIGTIGPNRASPTLLAALHDAAGEVREMAAWAIGQTGDRAAVRALTFAVGDPSPKTGMAALWSLAKIGGPEVRQPLMNAMDGEHVDLKLRAAMQRALAGEPVLSEPRPWPIPAIN